LEFGVRTQDTHSALSIILPPFQQRMDSSRIRAIYTISPTSNPSPISTVCVDFSRMTDTKDTKA